MPGDTDRPIQEIECLLANIDQSQSVVLGFENRRRSAQTLTVFCSDPLSFVHLPSPRTEQTESAQ
jgi:hypothetical protein